jgi:nitric oxide synthase-interacting protein
MARAAWGSSTAHLSRDSFLPFASCWLCLEPAIDPVACLHGDIFCRECALSNILAQKKEIKRAEKAREQEEREAQGEKARRDAEAQERAIREFELTQAGLSIKRGSTSGTGDGKMEPPPVERENQNENRKSESYGSEKKVVTGVKRKFSLDPDEVGRIAEEERAKARRAIDEEKVGKPLRFPREPPPKLTHNQYTQASRATLPSFWSPTVTPSSNSNNVLHEIKKKAKTQPACPAAPEDNPHHYSLHTLVTVNFTEEVDSDTKKPRRICPACNKGLSNSSRATLVKPCGHVLCKNCVDRFMKASSEEPVRCYVCEADVTEKPESSSGKKEGRTGKEKIRPGLVELRREGTGFSAGGSNQVKKNAVTFTV